MYTLLRKRTSTTLSGAAVAQRQSHKTGLTTRDLINVGVFTGVYFVIMFSLGMFGFFNPLMMFIGHSLAILANGITIALFLARVPKFGALTILGIIVSLFMTLTGHSWYTLLIGSGVALLGDLIASAKRYNSPLLNSLGYAMYSLWYIGPLFPVFFDTAGYRTYLESSMSVDYANAFMDFVTPHTIAIWGFTVFAIAVGGAIFGHRVLERHFRRAGLTT